jgi:hypothetical protein
MRKITIIALLFLNSLGLYAHNAQISTVALVQGKDSKWHLIISASLSAFQYELKNSDANINLDGLNADKFQAMILKHLREKIKIEANGQYATLKNARVILGHQTDINFEVTDMPENLQTIDFQQLGFSTLRDHFCVLKIITKNGNENSFMLQKDNNYNVSLATENNVLVEKINQSESNFLIYLWVILGIISLIIMYFKAPKYMVKGFRVNVYKN